MRLILAVTLAVVTGFAFGVATASRFTPAPKPVVVAAPAPASSPDDDIFLKAVDDAEGISRKIETGGMPLDKGIQDLEKDSDEMAKVAAADASRAFQLAPDDFQQRRDMLRAAFAGWVSVIEIDRQIKLAGKGKLDIQAEAAIKQAQNNATQIQTYIEDDTLPE